jgi:hypothetical protein
VPTSLDPTENKLPLVLLIMTADAENMIQGNHEFLDLQNQTKYSSSTPSIHVTGNEGLPVCEDNIRIPEDVWCLEQGQSMRYPMACKEEVMQALQQLRRTDHC